jgi:hypothetical protein
MPRAFALVLIVIAALAAPASASVVAGTQNYYIGYSDRLVTDVFLDGRGPFTFVIDTASSRTAIYEHVRRQLGMDYSSPDPITVYGINDKVSARAVEPGAIHVAGIEVKGITMGVLPDAAQRGDPDGVLGMDVLSRYFVVLDRKSMQFSLLSRDSAQTKAYTGWTQVSLQQRKLKNLPVKFWFVNAHFNEHPIWTLFDLGAGMTLLNWDGANQMNVRKKDFSRYGPPPEELRDVLGKVAPAVVAKNVVVWLPDHVWRSQDVLISDAPVFDFLEMSDRASAILGPGLLKDNSLAIDFQGGQLYLGPAVGQSQ